jgi:hypothetical protein
LETAPVRAAEIGGVLSQRLKKMVPFAEFMKSLGSILIG